MMIISLSLTSEENDAATAILAYNDELLDGFNYKFATSLPFFCLAITHRIITLFTGLNETIKTPFDEARLKVNIEKLQL